MTLSSGARLGPYEVLALLGKGGMGEVYRARDKKLDRDVAIKVLPDSIAADPDSLARFEREAKAVAALSHPNILSVFDFGTQDGTSYVVMELLEGETLRGKLDAGRIPQKQTLEYALQIAKGLSAAHESGIVHRDLKPENVFISRAGHLKILDFGLAKRVEAVPPANQMSTPTVSDHTAPGTVMGTVSYMSPEQVRGFSVDQRSDIFSFGAILYEMLSGRRAFSRPTASDTMAAILLQEPVDLSESGRNVSPALDHIVRHCLEKSPERRFRSAHDIVFALEESATGTITSSPRAATPPARTKRLRVVAAVAAAALAVGGVFLLRQPHKNTGEVAGPKRIAVLPFENLGVPEDDYFADAMADEIRSKLTSLPGVEVIARSSSTPYKKTTKTPGRIAQELEVRYLLTATVRWEKGADGATRVEVSPELVEVSGSRTPTSKWRQPFDAPVNSVLRVQSDIAARVAQALGVVLGAQEEKRLEEQPTQNFAAYDAFIRGEKASNNLGVNDPTSLRRAQVFYERAVARDPAFAQAWAQLARTAIRLYANGVPNPQLAERARQAAERAVALAPNRPEGYLALGDYQGSLLDDNDLALERYAEGQSRAPGSAELLTARALTEEALGRWDAAVAHFRKAERFDPRSLATQRRLGVALLSLRRYSEAREALDRGLALAPANLNVIENKAMSFLAQGDLVGARAVLHAAARQVDPAALVAYVATYQDLVWVLDEPQRELLLRLTPSAFDQDKASWGLCLAQAYALRGEVEKMRFYAEEARKALEEQLHAAPQDAQLHVLHGVALAYLARKEEAVREGERGVALQPLARDEYLGTYYQHQLVRIYIRVGEPEKALDRLEPLLKVPYLLSPGWLEIDPTFDPLRKNPRFQKLVAGGK